MPLRECVLLLPGYELDGFPRTLPSDQAAELLASWVGLWHPRLIAVTKTIPRWHQVDTPPSELSEAVFVVPTIAQESLPRSFTKSLAEAGGIMAKPSPDRRGFQLALLEQVDEAKLFGDTPPEEMPDELLTEFAAVGYAYLQIQLMTRQLRYTSNLDVAEFGDQVLAAAESAVAGRRDETESKLQVCFDTLGQERDHYYSLDVNLLDLTLLAESTLGKSLRRQLDAEHPSSYLANSTVLQKLSERSPETLERLTRAIDSQNACVIGGTVGSRPHPLMTRGAVARELEAARDAYQAFSIAPPEVYGNLEFSLQADSPTLLRRNGFRGVLLEPLSGGSYPDGTQTKMLWESPDGTLIDAISGTVLNAADPATFLTLGWTLGEALDHQHVPTVVLAHWPGQSCEYYELLQRIAERTPAMGSWMLADNFFRETDKPYHQDRLDESGFRYNWLAECEQASQLLMATKQFHIAQVRLRSALNLSNLLWQLSPKQQQTVAAATQTHGSESTSEPGSSDAAPASSSTKQVGSDEEAGAESAGGMPTSDPTNSGANDYEDGYDDDRPTAQALALKNWAPGLAAAAELADAILDCPAKADEKANAAIRAIDAETQSVTRQLAIRLCGANAAAPDVVNGRVTLNPRSCPMRLNATTDANTGYPPDTAWCYATGRVGDDRVTQVDVPSLGFVAGRFANATTTGSGDSPIAEVGGLLRNEFVEAQIDTGRGHLKSLHAPYRRGNRLSLMIARRTIDSQHQPVFTDMVASRVRMLTSSNVNGLVRATGTLEEEGRPVGKFEIDYELWRGSRVIETTIRLSELQSVADGNPWRDAYVARLAWANESAVVRAQHGGGQRTWSSGKAVAAEVIEIDEVDYKTHYLTGGLAFHRRVGMRFMETILACHGQKEVEHRIGIGVDLPHARHSAETLMDHDYEVPVHLGPQLPESCSGWLTSVDVKSVVVELECPLVDPSGKTVGMRIFVTEKSGKSTSATIRLFKDVASARRVDYLGGQIGKLTAKEDAVTIALRAHEQTNIDLIWQN